MIEHKGVAISFWIKDCTEHVSTLFDEIEEPVPSRILGSLILNLVCFVRFTVFLSLPLNHSTCPACSICIFEHRGHTCCMPTPHPARPPG